MKRGLSILLCGSLMAGMLCLPSMAAQPDLAAQKPALQGDFWVMVNGEYVTFPDAAPKSLNNRSFLPFAAVFEQLGFAQKDMHWDQATQTVTATKPDVDYTNVHGEAAVGDMTVELTLGSTTMKLWYEGDTIGDPHGNQAQVVQDVKMDVAPFANTAIGRTYIPLGLVAEALGYRVGWDQTNQTVIVDDVKSILAGNQETYELMDQLMDYSRTFAGKNYKVTGDYAMDMKMNGTSQSAGFQKMDMVFDLDGTYTMFTQGNTAFQYDTDLKMDFTVNMDGSDVTNAMLTQAGVTENPFPMDVTMEMRGDLADGNMYFRSKALAGLLGQADLENAWIKLDMKELMDQSSATLGMNYAQLLELSTAAQEMSFEEYLALTLQDTPATSIYSNAAYLLDQMNLMFADSKFVKSGNSYVNTVDLDGAKMVYTLYTNGSKVNGYAMEMSADMDQLGAMSLSATMKGTQMDMNMAFNVAMDQGAGESFAMDLSMTMDGNYQTTSVKPTTQPAAGDTVVDLMDLLGAAAEVPQIVA